MPFLMGYETIYACAKFFLLVRRLKEEVTNYLLPFSATGIQSMCLYSFFDSVISRIVAATYAP